MAYSDCSFHLQAGFSVPFLFVKEWMFGSLVILALSFRENQGEKAK
jgi:hypothetical protein